MMKGLIFFILIALISTSCNTKDGEITPIFESELNAISLTFDNRNSFVYYQNIAYFFDSDKELILFVQYHDMPSDTITSTSEFFVELNQAGSRLTIDIPSVSRTIFYQHDENIFGLGYIRGSDMIENIMIFDHGIGSYVFNPNVDPETWEEVHCGCVGNGGPHPTNCQSGGSSSTGCSISDSGGLFGFSWDHNCSTSCGSGTYACCTTDNQFGY